MHFNYNGFLTSTGYDLRFWNSNETVNLNYEIEHWDANGSSYVWVQIPELVDSNTCIWATWGDPAATNQEAYTTNGATWSEGYLAVWHLNQTNSAGEYEDSTSNTYDGVKVNSTNATGFIADAEGFDGAGDYIDSGANFLSARPDVTLHVWAYNRAFGGTRSYVGQDNAIEFGPNVDPEVWDGATLAGNPVPANEWVQVVTTDDDTQQRIYTNGFLDVSGSNGSGPGSSALNVKIGGQVWNGTSYLRRFVGRGPGFGRRPVVQLGLGHVLQCRVLTTSLPAIQSGAAAAVVLLPTPTQPQSRRPRRC